jgi:hypothetical protein
MSESHASSQRKAKRAAHSHQKRPTAPEPEVIDAVRDMPVPAVVVTRSARILAATGIASIRTILEPMVRSLRRRALLAVVVGLLWLAAISFALVALALFLATWIGPMWATLAIGALLGVTAMVLHLVSGSLSRPQL